MKKNVLALSVATMIGGLGFSGAAMAQAQFDLDTGANGHNGHIQIVPYFTAQDGNATALHVVNTDTKNGKAVKVRFRGAANSDDIMDFQVFLSPGDVWTGSVSADANGLMRLATQDSSCTLPANVRTSKGASAVTSRLSYPGWKDAAAKNAQTREGYVEILNMADIPQKQGDGKANPLYTAIKHKNGVAPCTAANMKFLDDVTDGGDAAGRIVTPTPTLVASWYIINIAKSTTFSGQATGLVATDAAGAVVGGVIGNPVYSPQMNGVPGLATADPLMVAGALAAEKFDVPDLSTPLVGDAADAALAAAQAAGLTTALIQKSVSNQFFQDESVSAATDWVFSMPTRRYTVAANYKANPDIKAAYIARNALIPAGNSLFAAGNGDLKIVDGKICVTTNQNALTVWDREENTAQAEDGHVISPAPARPQFELCGETSVMTFGSYSPLGAELTQQPISGVPFNEGWGTLEFPGVGAPVIGHAFTAASNPHASAGMVGNYGITWPHFRQAN